MRSLVFLTAIGRVSDDAQGAGGTLGDLMDDLGGRRGGDVDPRTPARIEDRRQSSGTVARVHAQVRLPHDSDLAVRVVFGYGTSHGVRGSEVRGSSFVAVRRSSFIVSLVTRRSSFVIRHSMR
jgi:hypothetical protein